MKLPFFLDDGKAFRGFQAAPALLPDLWGKNGHSFVKDFTKTVEGLPNSKRCRKNQSVVGKKISGKPKDPTAGGIDRPGREGDPH